MSFNYNHVNNEHILEINKVIKRTGHDNLLLEEECLIKISTEDIEKLNIEPMNSYIEKCRKKFLKKIIQEQ